MIAFVLVGLIADVWPNHGPPHFRYTGSDPANPVWNLGWPLVLFISDPKYGLDVGPFAYVVLPFQLLCVAVVLAVMAVQRALRAPAQKTEPSSECESVVQNEAPWDQSD